MTTPGTTRDQDRDTATTELHAAQHQKATADRRWCAAELETLAARRYYDDAEARLRHALNDYRRATT